MDLRKVQSMTGVVPLVAYLLFHLWETSYASSGRLTFSSRVTGSGGGALSLVLEVVLVLLPLLVHAGLGLWLALRDRGSAEAGSYGSRGMRNVQRVTGVVALLFVLVHVAQTWMGKLAGGDATLAYDTLRAQVGMPVYLVLYVVGITCVCFHVAQGVGAFAHAWGLAKGAGQVRALRFAGVALGVVLWVVSLNTVSHFAVGRTLLGPSSADIEPGAPTAEPPVGSAGEGGT